MIDRVKNVKATLAAHPRIRRALILLASLALIVWIGSIVHYRLTHVEEIDARDISRIRISPADEPNPIFVRVGKYGPFLEHGERRASLPEDLPPDEVTVAKAEELLSQAAVADQPLGNCPETGKPVYVKVGRFGPYVQRGTMEDEEKPKNASLMKGMKVEDVDLETALKLLSLPRTLGEHPETKEPVEAHNGRFGGACKTGGFALFMKKPLWAMGEDAVMNGWSLFSKACASQQ